jgi:chromosome segregation ATPase
MEEEEDISVSQLKTVYKAQTEAYLDFNLALIQVLTNQESIIKDLESLKKDHVKEFRELEKNYFAMKSLLENFQILINQKEQNIETAVEEYTAQISHFGAELENLKREIDVLFKREFDDVQQEISKIKKNQWDFKNIGIRAAWVVGSIVTFLTVVNLFTGRTVKELLGF